MPTVTIVIVAGIVLAFAVFAVSLAWAAFYTRGVRTPGATYFNEPSKQYHFGRRQPLSFYRGLRLAGEPAGHAGGGPTSPENLMEPF